MKSEKKQLGNVKDQYKVFKDQLNVINKNREDDVEAEDDVKAEDGEIIDHVNYRYIGDKYKNLIDNIFSYGLKEKE